MHDWGWLDAQQTMRQCSDVDCQDCLHRGLFTYVIGFTPSALHLKQIGPALHVRSCVGAAIGSRPAAGVDATDEADANVLQVQSRHTTGIEPMQRLYRAGSHGTQ